jgi:hypothetical protein
MAERTLAEVATAGKPSMTPDGAEEEAYDNWIEVRGPRKCEFFMFQQAAANDFQAEDTFNTKLAHPLYATITPVSDLAGTALPGSVSVDSLESSATFKTFTIYDCEGINSLGILITVFGF